MVESATLKNNKLDHLMLMLNFDLAHLQRPSLLSNLETDSFKTPKVIIGIDEVGRGCLAGPVVAAAVMLPTIDQDSELAFQLKDLDDSKTLTAETRKALSLVISANSIYAICEASVEEIDSINILQASLLAMKRARLSLVDVPPPIVLVDGNKTIPGISDIQITVIKGDSQSAAIAAASIIAKVYRDEMMCKLAEEFPDYQWHSNKGYPSREHKLAIARAGLSPWHRRSFNFKLNN